MQQTHLDNTDNVRYKQLANGGAYMSSLAKQPA